MVVGLWFFCLTVIENHYFKEIEFYFIKFLMCNKVYKGRTVNDTLYLNQIYNSIVKHNLEKKTDFNTDFSNNISVTHLFTFSCNLNLKLFHTNVMRISEASEEI